MKLSIKPVQEHRNRVFTSADVVVGVIYLDVNDSITISRIQFSLKARLRSSEVSPVQYEYARRPGFITLFETSRVLLFPERPLCKSTRYTLGKGRHEYQFSVDLSLLSRYASAELLLDPSIYAARRWETGRISYTICVTVQGCGLLRRQIRESMYLTSVSLDPPGFPPFPPSHDLSGLTCQVIPLCAFGLQSEPRRDDGSAPPYSSAIVLRAGISSGDGQLRAGDPLPLRFWITVPLAARRQLKAYLKSIRLFLIDPAVVTVGGRRVVDLVGIAIREVRLEIALDAVTKNETIEVDPTLWKDCRVPPSAAESTSLHEVDRKYLLQILCEFSYDETSSSKLATVLVPVAIATAGAPPGYRAVADKCQYCAGEGDLPRYEVSPIAGGEHFADGHSNMQDAWQEILR